MTNWTRENIAWAAGFIGATAHNALDDARAQARAVIAAYVKLGLAATSATTEAAA